jgi:hypothetical protein
LYTVVVVARVLGCSTSPPLGYAVDSGFLSRMLRLLLVAGCSVFSMRRAVLPLVVLPPAVVNLPPLTLVLLAFDNEETRVPSSSVLFSWGLFALPLVPFGFTGLAIPVVRVRDEELRVVVVVVVALAHCVGGFKLLSP